MKTIKLLITTALDVLGQISIRGGWETLKYLCVSEMLLFKRKDFIYDRKHELNMRFLIDNIPVRLLDENISPISNYRIWTLWWQGENDMPEVVKMAYNSLKKFSNKEVVLITKDNYKEYIVIPSFIEARLRDQEIGLAHFSDYIRIALLCKYGGMWIDSTVFFAKEMPSWVYEQDFFTVKANSYDHKYMPRGRWNMQVLGSKNAKCPIFVYMKQYLEEYWKKYNKAIDYLFFDYGMQIMYDENNICKELIDKVPASNEHMHKLRSIMNDVYDATCLNGWSDDGTWMYKLTYKQNYLEENKGKKTYYGYLKSCSPILFDR